MDVDDLVFRSRALAQTHPHSRTADRFVRATIARERANQPMHEIGDWAGYAITTGYCLRKVEESMVGDPVPLADVDWRESDLEGAVADVVRIVRSTDSQAPYLLEPDTVVATLDHLIVGEIDRRLDQWKDELEAEVWQSLEDYLAWWLIAGYALRIVETRPVEEE
ncbi:MAG: hypothetical protein HKN07_16105 [Acidimicrobiia bacterium]|nr:hypothetical protein [Acidimicrobiia bacterium]